uniref:Immunoglobulin C1-set domain-containing protein n=1 Tax=Cyprinus carpio TaxID=7962 RepID=A0A8C1K8H9_CYPCA
MFASAAPHDQSELILTCLATGFSPKLTEMKITLNNITLQPFSSSGVRPNDNQSFQMRASVKIHRDEKQGYKCHVLHSGQTFTTTWDGSLESRSHHWAAVAAGAFAIAVLCIMSLIYKNRRFNERHHLLFVYTVLTKPDGVSGPVFSAVCLYDDRWISHYSNEEQTWNRDRFDPEIWRYTREPDDSRDWFINLLNTLANCTSSRCDGLHTLQRRVGCEVDKHPDGAVMNVNALDEYGYDGEDFLFFNYYTMQWIDKSPKAKETKIKWDSDRVHNHYLQLYLKDCMVWIATYNASISTPPALHMFASAAPHDQSELNLTCLATGFSPKLIEMKITLNNITLKPFSSSGVRPNDNQSFQMRASVKIHRDEKQGYECHVLHSGQTFTTSWDGSLGSRSHHWAAVAAGAFAIEVLYITYLIYKNRWLNGQMNRNSSTTEQRDNITSRSADPLTASDSHENNELL